MSLQSSRVLALVMLASLQSQLLRAGADPVLREGAPVAVEPLAGRDGRRTGSHFLANLGRNSVGLFARDNLAPFAIGAAATGPGEWLDDNAERFFESRRRARWLGESGAALGKPYVLTPLALALYGSGRLARGHQRYRDASYDIAQVFLVTAAYTTVLKYATSRERPDASDSRSFPSGHTSNAFAWATVAGHHYGPRLGVPAFVVAGLVGVSRMEADAHHLTDVLGGATLGYLVGRTVVRRDADGSARPPRVHILPGVTPSGLSLALAVRLPHRRF